MVLDVLCSGAGAAAGTGDWPLAAPEAEEAAPAIDPQAFLDEVIDRYRRLVAYEDTARVVQVTMREGEDPQRVETRIACTIEQGALRITTPGSQVRDGIGLDVGLPRSPAMERLVLRYNLWLAPHLVFHFVEDPLGEFRLGVEEGFTVVKAQETTLNESKLVRLELVSGDGLSADVTARFNLFVDPHSMLIERVEGRQRLPDGSEYHTTLQITPLRAVVEE